MLGCYFSDCSFLGDQSNYNSFISVVRTRANRSTKHQKRKGTKTIQGDRNSVAGSYRIEGNAKLVSYK